MRAEPPVPKARTRRIKSVNEGTEGQKIESARSGNVETVFHDMNSYSELTADS